MGGFAGKSLWVEDYADTETKCYRAMHDGLKLPWLDQRQEIRVIDVPFTDRAGKKEVTPCYCV